LELSLIRTAVLTFDKDDGSVENTNYGWTRLIWVFKVRHPLYWFIVSGCHDCHSCVCVSAITDVGTFYCIYMFKYVRPACPCICEIVPCKY